MTEKTQIMVYSIIVCAHNARDRITPTLEHLINLDYANDRYEIIVVDNCSTDGTSEYVTKFWAHLSCNVNFKLVKEINLGLSFARWAGIRASSGKFCLFCDDDNWLNKDYLQVADKRFMIEGDQTLLGGAGIPVFDRCHSALPPHLFSNSSMFAIGSQSLVPEYITLKRGWLFGAGLIIPTQALRELDADGFCHKLSDRKGKQLSSGGDLELCYVLTMRGLRVFSDPNLLFKHQIPDSRLSLNYLVELTSALANDDAELKKYQKMISLLRTQSVTKRIMSATLDLLRSPNQLTLEGVIFSLLGPRFRYKILPVNWVRVSFIC